MKPEDLMKFHFISDPQISPDGSEILFHKGVITEKNKVLNHLWLLDCHTRHSRQLTQGENGVGSGRWSPGGKEIAFVSGREKPSQQIYLLPREGGEARKLTNLPEGALNGLTWSPDGKLLAFQFRAVPHERTTAASKEREEKGLSTPPWVLEDLFYKLDGDGVFGGARHTLWVVSVETGEMREVYKGDPTGFGSFEWLPDSSGFIVAHSAHREPILHDPNDQLFFVPLEGEPEQITQWEGVTINRIAVSPDGRRIAFLGDTDPRDVWGTRNVKVYGLNRNGAELRCLSQDDYCLSVPSLSDTGAGGEPFLSWLPDSETLRVMVGWWGEAHIATVSWSEPGVKPLTFGKFVLGLGNLSQDGTKQALVHATKTTLNEVALWDGHSVQTLTDFNGPVLAELDLVEPEDQTLVTEDGSTLHFWVMQPKSAAKIPAIIEIHGGPHTQYCHAYFHEFQVLCAAGYAVVFSNPRGSKGYGEAHTRAIERNWGDKDWIDIRSLLEWLKGQSWVDPGRIGVMGGSYGGYMTNWAIGHTTDFRAAITDRCVLNWTSMAGSCDFPLNRKGYFGANAWEPHEAISHLWQQSPLSHWHKVNTPTLVIHSEGDLRCPIEQGDQAFATLKALGVKTRYVRYPASTSHGLSRTGPPDLRLHRLHQILIWWDEHLA